MTGPEAWAAMLPKDEKIEATATFDAEVQALVAELWASDAASALTNRAARTISALLTRLSEARAKVLKEVADRIEDYCSDMPDLAGHGHSVGLRDVILAPIQKG